MADGRRKRPEKHLGKTAVLFYCREKGDKNQMLKSCKYCGRIHDERYVCDKKTRRTRTAEDSEIASFRRSQRWTKTSRAVRERDKNLCQVCLRGLYLTHQTISYSKVSVHHIVPMKDNRELATDRKNLITLCPFHHELAESGYIPRGELMRIVEEQEKKDQEAE